MTNTQNTRPLPYRTPLTLSRSLLLAVGSFLTLALVGAAHVRHTDQSGKTLPTLAAAVPVIAKPVIAKPVSSRARPAAREQAPVAPAILAAYRVEVETDTTTSAPSAPGVVREAEAIPAAAVIPAARPAAPKSARVLFMEVTAYCPCKKCCGPLARGLTASGKPVSYNNSRFVAADTRILPFGKQLLIPGYAGGQAVEVIDKGGAIKGHKLDVYFPTHQEARKWGRQKLMVTVLD